MKEREVFFTPRTLPGVRLEGRLIEGPGAPCVVAHPHPLAGGSMDHPVVDALWRAAGAAGRRALKFNFRGVGRSSGRLTERSPLATADLEGALAFVAPGGEPVVAAGYSYGARTVLHALAAGAPIARALLVALPTRLPANPAAMSHLLLGRRIPEEQWVPAPDLELLAAPLPAPVLVAAGDRDPLVDLEALKARGVPLRVVPGCNHFFSRRRGNQPPEPDALDLLCRLLLDPGADP